MQFEQGPGTEDIDVLYAREFTHRATNMLQIALAALHHGRQQGSRGINSAIASITAAADLHRMLTSTAAQIVELDVVLTDVCNAVQRSLGKSHLVQWSVTAPPLLVLPENARRVAMMVAELVGNSMRHAFPNGTGSLYIDCTDDGIRTDIVIEDDGACATWRRTGGQGCGIVDAIAKDLGGNISRSNTFLGSLRIEIALPSISAVAQPCHGHV